MTTVALFMIGSFLVFADRQILALLLVMTSGLLSIVFSKAMAEAQNRINFATRKFTINSWGESRPLLFVLWGSGILLIGLRMFFGG